jgi:hypothetical protein
MDSSSPSTAMPWRSRRTRFVSLIATPTLVMVLSAAAGATVRCVSASGLLSPGQVKQYACALPLYTTIGSAVAASSANDTIYVFNGTYPESVTISPSLSGLSLIGVAWKGNNPTINAATHTNGVLDHASGVTIESFTIESANHEGILVEGAAATCASGPPVSCTPAAAPINNVTISYNVVTNNDLSLSAGTCPGAPEFEQDDCGEGIHLDGVAFSTVSYNLVNHNSGGILDTDETNTNHDNLISFNNVSNNDEDCGITLPSHPANGSAANIGFAFGVFHDSIISNLVAYNGDAGVGIFAPTPVNASYNHLVAGNRIIGNGNPGVTFHAHTSGTNLGGTTIINNIIQYNGADPEPGAPAEGAGPSDPTGIEIFASADSSLPAPPIDARIEGNTINNETNDIWIGAPGWDFCSSVPFSTPCYAVSANLNNLTGSNVGVNNTGDAGSVIVNATNDYWGCRSGPNTSYCTSTEGNVLANPFLSFPTFIIGLALP